MSNWEAGDREQGPIENQNMGKPLPTPLPLGVKCAAFPAARGPWRPGLVAARTSRG